jgi:hypothetical protein
MYRRFGMLHQRVLLQRQDEICELEDNLKSMDLADYQLDAELLMSREKDEVIRGSHERRNLIEKIHTKLKDYGLTNRMNSSAPMLTILRRPPILRASPSISREAEQTKLGKLVELDRQQPSSGFNRKGLLTQQKRLHPPWAGEAKLHCR